MLVQGGFRDSVILAAWPQNRTIGAIIVLGQVTIDREAPSIVNEESSQAGRFVVL
jgi:hypothetical protein